MSTRFLRLCVVVLGLALLSGPALQAAESAPPKLATVKSATASPVHQAWGWLVSLWDAVGCSIDPSGGCIPAGAPSEPVELDFGDVGCSIDPSGCPK
jgi:hypothetical protein